MTVWLNNYTYTSERPRNNFTRGVMPTPIHPKIADHLRDHLVDGRWHDECPYCERRRVHGGTGVERDRQGAGVMGDV